MALAFNNYSRLNPKAEEAWNSPRAGLVRFCSVSGIVLLDLSKLHSFNYSVQEKLNRQMRQTETRCSPIRKEETALYGPGIETLPERLEVLPTLGRSDRLVDWESRRQTGASWTRHQQGLLSVFTRAASAVFQKLSEVPPNSLIGQREIDRPPGLTRKPPWFSGEVIPSTANTYAGCILQSAF